MEDEIELRRYFVPHVKCSHCRHITTIPACFMRHEQ